MSTVDTVHPAPRPRPSAPRREAIPTHRLLTTELRKMFDTRSGFWLMASIGIAALLATTAVILFAPNDQMRTARSAQLSASRWRSSCRSSRPCR